MRTMILFSSVSEGLNILFFEILESGVGTNVEELEEVC